IALDQLPAALDQIDLWIKELRPGDSWSLFAVGRGVRQFESVEALRETLKKWQTGLSDDEFRSASKLGDAMLAARAAFLAGNARRATRRRTADNRSLRRRHEYPWRQRVDR